MKIELASVCFARVGVCKVALESSACNQKP